MADTQAAAITASFWKPRRCRSTYTKSFGLSMSLTPFSKQDRPLNNNHSTEFCTSMFCASMSCVSVPLCDTGKANEVLANIEGVRRRREALKQRFPELTELYETFIEPKFKATAAHRNGFIVE